MGTEISSSGIMMNNEHTRYRIPGSTGRDGGIWSETAVRPPRFERPGLLPGEQVTPAEQQQMDRLGVTRGQKSVYTYGQHVYDRLADALAYARIDKAREAESSSAE
jgi:hypothetical protein